VDGESWKLKFKSHILQNLSGPINVILDDIDKDGDLDIISLVSQEWEEIYCFINDGKEILHQSCFMVQAMKTLVPAASIYAI